MVMPRRRRSSQLHLRLAVWTCLFTGASTVTVASSGLNMDDTTATTTTSSLSSSSSTITRKRRRQTSAAHLAVDSSPTTTATTSTTTTTTTTTGRNDDDGSATMDNEHLQKGQNHLQGRRSLVRNGLERGLDTNKEEKEHSTNSHAGNKDDIDHKYEYLHTLSDWQENGMPDVELGTNKQDGEDPTQKNGQGTNIEWVSTNDRPFGNDGDFLAEAFQADEAPGAPAMMTMFFSMTDKPSDIPTMVPSDMPTDAVVTTPLPTSTTPSSGTPETIEPTTIVAPTTTASPTPPTSLECEELSRNVVILERLMMYTDLETLEDDSTPQGQAFDWILDEDPAQVDPCTDLLQLDQRYALATLYYATTGVDWTDNIGWLSGTNECEWTDIVCNDNLEVAEFTMSSNNMVGELPNELEVLTLLQLVDVSSNLLSGSVPTILPQLTMLTSFRADMNVLSGNLPTNIGLSMSLEELSLAENMISGSIPTLIGGLENLSILRIDRNQLVGSIPSEMGSLSQLIVFTAIGNRLTGSIPEELWERMTQLEMLLMGSNTLTGTLSSSISNMQSLRDLDLTSNRLQGTLPVLLGRLSSLVQLKLGNNALEGTIRDSFSSFTSLREIDLSLNRFSGSIPSRLFDLTSVEDIALNDNALDGTLPNNMGNAAALESFFLHSNFLSGQVPDIAAGQWTNLNVLQLQDNQFTGTMAPSICELRMEGELNALWSDCGDTASPRLECDVPECCTMCFPQSFLRNKAEGIVGGR